MVLIHNGTLQNGAITKNNETVHFKKVSYTTVRYKTEQHYKMVRCSLWYMTKRYSYKTVYLTKWYTVTKRHAVKKWYVQNNTVS
jgi:hypothetical protein